MKELFKFESKEQSRLRVLLKALTTLNRSGFLKSNSNECDDVGAF